jgi:predicted transcriptional regulator
MAIHPKYAEAILDGRKRVEFRKRRLAPDVRIVLIYATSPVKRIIGHFTIDDTVAASPDELWEEFADVGGIEKGDFLDYFADSAIGIGLVVKKASRLPDALRLDSIESRPVPPQSFSYLESDALGNVVGPSVRVAWDVALGGC